MSVAAHLGISLTEYDQRIRTFIPHYEEMLDAAAAALDPHTRVIVDLGIGTGALSARCLGTVPRARTVGIDEDAAVLSMAKRRLGRKATLITGNLESASLPRCHAVVASFALHHIRTKIAKARLYRRVLKALRPQGVLINADCCPALDPTLAEKGWLAWRAHLRSNYSPAQAAAYFRAWAREDVYFPLNVERHMLKTAGFDVDVAWRRNAFAVLVARKPRTQQG